MLIRIGCELLYDCPQPTPMLLTLNVHCTHVSAMVVVDHLVTSSSVPIATALVIGATGSWRRPDELGSLPTGS
jgi:hypothetical protein